ncbi:MAG: hypothetical protein WC378_00165 [Opitutaceae bacterium]|jgi:hypothetical protein
MGLKAWFRRGKKAPPDWEQVFADRDRLADLVEGLEQRIRRLRWAAHNLYVIAYKAAQCENNCKMCKMLLHPVCRDAYKVLDRENQREAAHERVRPGNQD